MLITILTFTGGAIVGAVVGAFAMAIFCAKGTMDLYTEIADLEARIDRALDKVTDKSAYVGRKMAEILKGEDVA